MIGGTNSSDSTRAIQELAFAQYANNLRNKVGHKGKKVSSHSIGTRASIAKDSNGNVNQGVVIGRGQKVPIDKKPSGLNKDLEGLNFEQQKDPDEPPRAKKKQSKQRGISVGQHI